MRELGKGGEGTVYLAVHLFTDVLRAVKISSCNSGIWNLHELEMMKKVSHPSLPHILDVEQDADRICLVMEYIPGCTMLEYARTRQITEKIFFRVAGQLLDALEYLHCGQFPMLHLDVKPSNIIMCDDERLVLLDLGAAMPLTPDLVSKRGMGTVGYAAPEQFGRSGRLTVRTDLYGFGATMYFFLYGQKYDAAAAGIRLKKAGDLNWLSVSHVWTDGLAHKSSAFSVRWKKRAEKLLFECLRQNPERRPASVHAVKVKLRKMEKRYGRKKRSLQLATVISVLSCLFILSGQKPAGESGNTEEQNQRYQELLEEAELSGDGQAYEIYKTAASMAPDRPEAFQKLIGRMTSDLCFTLEEEGFLRQLFSVRAENGTDSLYERLQEQRKLFGELAYQIGIAYWYFYEGSGGRTAAASWFIRAEQAAKAEEISEVWTKEVAIYARIGRYYEKLGRQEAEEQLSSSGYWTELCALSQIVFGEKGDEAIGSAVKKCILEERLNLLIFESAALREAGLLKQDLLDEIREMQLWGADQILPDRCQDAEKAVERAYDERR